MRRTEGPLAAALLGAMLLTAACEDDGESCTPLEGTAHCEVEDQCEDADVCHWRSDTGYQYYDGWQGTCGPPCPETCCPAGWSCAENGRCLPKDEPGYCTLPSSATSSEVLVCTNEYHDDCDVEGTVASSEIIAGAGGSGLDALVVVLENDQASVRVPIPSGAANPVKLGDQVRVISMGSTSPSIEIRGADDRPLAAKSHIAYWDWPPLLSTFSARARLGQRLCAPLQAWGDGFLLDRKHYIQITAMDLFESDHPDAALLASLEPGQSTDIEVEGIEFRVTSLTSYDYFCNCDCDPMCGNGRFALVRK